MGWVKRKADEHVCNLPELTGNFNKDRIATGDIWECDECHSQHKVTVHQSPHDGFWLTWERYDKPVVPPPPYTSNWRP